MIPEYRLKNGYVISPHDYRAKCRECGCMTAKWPTEAEAAEHWNASYERTCRMDACGDPADPSLNRSRTCTACGAHGIYSEYYDADCHIACMRYCPECGAKVVER